MTNKDIDKIISDPRFKEQLSRAIRNYCLLHIIPIIKANSGKNRINGSSLILTEGWATYDDAAILLKVASETVRSWVQSGKIEGGGGIVRIATAKEYMNGNRKRGGRLGMRGVVIKGTMSYKDASAHYGYPISFFHRVISLKKVEGGRGVVNIKSLDAYIEKRKNK